MKTQNNKEDEKHNIVNIEIKDDSIYFKDIVWNEYRIFKKNEDLFDYIIDNNPSIFSLEDAVFDEDLNSYVNSDKFKRPKKRWPVFRKKSIEEQKKEESQKRVIKRKMMITVFRSKYDFSFNLFRKILNIKMYQKYIEDNPYHNLALLMKPGEKEKPCWTIDQRILDFTLKFKKELKKLKEDGDENLIPIALFLGIKSSDGLKEYLGQTTFDLIKANSFYKNKVISKILLGRTIDMEDLFFSIPEFKMSLKQLLQTTSQTPVSILDRVLYFKLEVRGFNRSFHLIEIDYQNGMEKKEKIDAIFASFIGNQIKNLNAFSTFCDIARVLRQIKMPCKKIIKFLEHTDNEHENKRKRYYGGDYENLHDYYSSFFHRRFWRNGQKRRNNITIRTLNYHLPKGKKIDKILSKEGIKRSDKIGVAFDLIKGYIYTKNMNYIEDDLNIKEILNHEKLDASMPIEKEEYPFKYNLPGRGVKPSLPVKLLNQIRDSSLRKIKQEISLSNQKKLNLIQNIFENEQEYDFKSKDHEGNSILFKIIHSLRDDFFIPKIIDSSDETEKILSLIDRKCNNMDHRNKYNWTPQMYAAVNLKENSQKKFPKSFWDFNLNNSLERQAYLFLLYKNGRYQEMLKNIKNLEDFNIVNLNGDNLFDIIFNDFRITQNATFIKENSEKLRNLVEDILSLDFFDINHIKEMLNNFTGEVYIHNEEKVRKEIKLMIENIETKKAMFNNTYADSEFNL